MTEVWGKLIAMQIDPHDVVAIGMTNQRESTIIWDKNTGKPYYNAIREYNIMMHHANACIKV